MKPVVGTLIELAEQISGYAASVLSTCQGVIVEQHSRSDLDLQAANNHMTGLISLGGSELEDVLMTTTRHYILIKLLPGKTHFLGIFVDRPSANLGQVRLMSKLMAEKIFRNIPEVPKK